MPYKRYGLRIKALREAKGLTQEVLANKAGIHRVYLAQLEGSAKSPPTRTPSLPMLEKLAKALNVTAADLIGEGKPARKRAGK